MAFSMQELTGQNDQNQPQPNTPAAPASSPQAAAPATKPNTVVNATPTSPKDPSSFSMTELGAPPDPTQDEKSQAQQAQAQKDEAEKQRKSEIAKHGLLHRTWDWVNQPIFDNVLPEGIKTADILKAGAFEKLYGEAYIPGVNDFDTKAETQFGMKNGKATNPKDDVNAQKGAIRKFLEDHTAGFSEALLNKEGRRAFGAGSARDTSDVAAGFSSPLSLATLGLGSEEVQGAKAVGKIAKVVSPLVGTAFGLQGAYNAAHGGYKMATEGATPENVQETLGGLGQAALGAHSTVHTAGQIGESLREGVRPVTKTIAGQEVPVRPKGFLSDVAAKSVDSSVLDKAAENTAGAVQKGVGEVTKGAVGSDADTNVGDRDRFGVRSHADDLESKSVPAYKELDALSDNEFSDAQARAKRSKLDFSTEGREKYEQALADQDDIMYRFRNELAAKGYDVDEVRGNYRKSVALNKIATSFDTATGPKAGGGYEVDGEKLANQIDKLRRAPADKNLFDKAGLAKSHVDALAQLADTLREEQVKPKFGGLTKLAAKALAIGSFGHGITGLAEALTGESMAEKIGSKVMTRLFGEAMTSEPAARQLNQVIKAGPQALSNWDKFKLTAKNLWESEQGFAGQPGTVPDSTDEAQVAAHQANGGSTFDTNGQNLAGTDNYSVGAYPDRTAQIQGDLTPDHIRRFKTLNADLLNQEGHGIGTWQDQDTGNHVLDVSKLYGDRDQAVAAGQAANQKAIYHLGGEGEIQTGGTGEGNLTDALKQKYGTTSDVLKAGFILPEGDMVPLVGEHDHMLGGKTTEDTREQFIRDSGAIRTRYRMTRAGEQQVFSLPSEITEGQARQIRAAAGKLRNGSIVLETVDGKNHQTLDFPTGSKAQSALENLVKIKPEAEEAPTEPSFNLVSAPDGSSHTLEINKGDDTIGHLEIEQGTPDSWTIKNAVVQKGEAGKGYGKAAYEQAFQKASDAGMKTVESDISNTSKAASVWKSLMKDHPEAVTEENGQYTVDLDKLNGNTQEQLEPKEITTRRPTAVKADMGNNPSQHANMDAINQAGENSPSRLTQGGSPVMGYKEKLARTVANYTGVDYSPEELANPDKVLSKFVNHVSSNLEWLYNQVPEEIRAKTAKWYDSAHQVTKQFAKQYDLTHEQAAGVTAALSPQNPWDNNIALAKRMMDTYKNRQEMHYTPEMEQKAAELKKVPTQSKAFKGLLKDIDGKALKDVKNADPDVQAVQRALWIRLYDEAHNSSVNDLYAPTGEVTGHSPDSRSWIGLDHMGKAVKIIEDGSVKNINDVMGQGHKIRNFYNNIINPDSKNGHVTIDTHATAAGQLQPFGAKDTETAHTFGNSTPGTPGPPKDASTGLQGTYPLYAEAYQRTARKLGIQPRELQSITWEAIKSLMGDEKKTPELKAKAKEIWQEVQDGRLTPEQARETIKNESGGFSKPSWMSEEEWERTGPENGDTSFNPEGGK